MKSCDQRSSHNEPSSVLVKAWFCRKAGGKVRHIFNIAFESFSFYVEVGHFCNLADNLKAAVLSFLHPCCYLYLKWGAGGNLLWQNSWKCLIKTLAGLMFSKGLPSLLFWPILLQAEAATGISPCSQWLNLFFFFSNWISSRVNWFVVRCQIVNLKWIKSWINTHKHTHAHT